jgi:hypothetical protein
VLLAAIVALAIAVAPVYASGAIPCPCSAAATDCPCHAGGCDMSTPPAGACHCAPAALLWAASAADLGMVLRVDRWLASPSARLWGLQQPPPLRPPIFV